MFKIRSFTIYFNSIAVNKNSFLLKKLCVIKKNLMFLKFFMLLFKIFKLTFNFRIFLNNCCGCLNVSTQISQKRKKNGRDST